MPHKLSELVAQYLEQVGSMKIPNYPVMLPQDYNAALLQIDALNRELSMRLTPPDLWCENCLGRGFIAPSTYCDLPDCPASRKLRFDRLYKMMKNWSHIPNLYADYSFESWREIDEPLLNKKQLGEIMCRYFATHVGNFFSFEDVINSEIAEIVLPELAGASIIPIDYESDNPDFYYERLNISLKTKKGTDYLIRQNSYGNSLVLAGEKGVGKTGLSIAVVKSLINLGKPVAYIHLATFIRDIKATYGGTGDIKHLIDPIAKADVLVVDEFGMPEQVASDHNIGLVEDFIITPRWSQKKPILITTNHSPKTFESHWGGTNQRLASRVFEMCHWVTLSGHVIRRRNRPLG